jgi:hypothetical protein
MTESVQIGFARILVTGKTAEKLGFTEAIHTYTRFKIEHGGKFDKHRGYSTFLQEYCKPLFGKDGLFRREDDGEPILNPTKTNIIQIIDVKPVREEITALNARRFIKDVRGIDQGWDEPIVRRYTFTTETPLPGCAPVVPVRVSETKVTSIAKAAYYEAKLRGFRDKLRQTTEDVSAILPPEGVEKVWTQSVLGLSAAPLLKFMRKISEATPEKNKGYYSIARDVFTSIATTDAPTRISQLILEIRDLLIDAIRLAEKLADISPLTADDKKILEEFRKYFGVPAGLLARAA